MIHDKVIVEAPVSAPLSINSVALPPMSASAKKIKTVPVPVEVTGTEDTPSCNIIVDTRMLLDFFNEIDARCPKCSCKLNIHHNPKQKCGLAHFLVAECSCECSSLCEWSFTQATSPQVDPPRKVVGQKPYDVNLRSVLAFREVGRGFTSLQDFCMYMNMPPPMDRKSYRKSFNRLYRAYKKISNESVISAAADVEASRDEGGVADVMASFDGSWQKRGYSSKNGVITGISGGKVVDYEVMSKVCKQCKYWKKKKSGKDYEDWLLHHDCNINHIGSSGSMEVEGVKKMFSRSVADRKLRYTTYLGDGDSKGFATVQAMNVYPERPGCPVKAECVGHVQKRVGTRLRTYKVNHKGKLLSDGKGLSGQGRLTEKVMNTLQNYYGMVIRSNKSNIYGMKKGIAAIVHHCSEFLDGDNNPDNVQRHKFCPRGADSWCKWQQDQSTGLSTYKSKICLPAAIRDLIMPIFSYEDLAADSLLERCLHGLTQNVNEAFNQLIWRRAPKDTFVARRTLEVATASAVLHFNDGKSGILKVLKELGITPGHYTVLSSSESNKSRIRQMNRKSTEKVMKARKKDRAIAKGYIDNENDDEDKIPSYFSGGF